MESETDQPFVLFYDPDSRSARAAALPRSLKEDCGEFHFRGAKFVRTCHGLVFWDYLLYNGEIVGLLLIDFELDPALESSRLLKASLNIGQDVIGYNVLLASGATEAESDGAQAFGCSLFEHDDECLLLLPDWHRRGYGFPLDLGLIST